MFFRLLKYSVKNTLRNKFLSLSSILVLTLLMFFINVLGVLEDVGGKVIDSINSKMTISLYLKEEYGKNTLEVLDMVSDIEKLNRGVKVVYKDKETLINEMREKEPSLVKILERDNPLPDTIEISNISISDYEAVNRIIENKMFILSDNKDDKDYFANYATQYKKINQVTSILDVLKMGLYIIIVVFFVSISVIIYSVISNFIYYYKDEIYITKLVGGSNVFIYGPFVLQGVLYSVVSFVLNLFIFSILLKNLEILFGEYYSFSIAPNILLIELVIFICIGAVSGYISSKKFLKRALK